MFESSQSETLFSWENPLLPTIDSLSEIDKTHSSYYAEATAPLSKDLAAEVELSLVSAERIELTPNQILADSNWLPTPTTDLLTRSNIEPGNTLATAFDLGILTATQTASEFVGLTDLSDYYRVYIENPSSLNITLTGSGADADIELIQDQNLNGWVEYNEYIDRSYGLTSSEQINLRNIDPGFYYIHVKQYSGEINYTLSVTTGNPIPVPPDFAGNTTPTAYDFGIVNTPQFLTEYVGQEDFSDYYRLTVETPSRLNAFLDGVTGSASVMIGQDLNNNGGVEWSEELDWSYGSLVQPANVSVSYLEPGTYYLKVYTFDDEVQYNLNLSTTPVTPLPPDLAGNTLSTAYAIGGLETPQIVTDFVSNGDTVDYYRFDLTTDSRLNLSLDQLSADADVAVIRDINNDGIASHTEVLQVSTNPGINTDSLSANLIAGIYYVAVFQYEGDTSYNLNLSATPTPPLPNNPGTNLAGFDANFGYGLIDASVAVAAAQGLPTAFVDIPNSLPVVESNVTDLDQIRVPEVWNQGITGEGVIVAVIDSGVDLNHPDLVNNIWRNSDEILGNGIDDDLNGYVDDVQGYDFVDNDNDPSDLEGHGTHVAGTIAAARDGSDLTSIGDIYEVSGVAYDATIMPVRVLGNGSGYKTPAQQDATLANAIRYAVDNDATVLNMSLGISFWDSAGLDFPLTNAALSYAADNNVVAVISAGNERDLGGTFPSQPALQATEERAIAVGAVDSNGLFAYFSNPASSFSGAYPYVVAPGIGVISTTPNNSYDRFDGTSMAAPHVTGVVALMQQANPNLTPAEIATILTQSANPTGIVV
ncbi:MAG: S8 family serine peptidase [Microcoleaceae cyanobacterium]